MRPQPLGCGNSSLGHAYRVARVPSMRPQPLGCGNKYGENMISKPVITFNEAATVRLRKSPQEPLYMQ